MYHRWWDDALVSMAHSLLVFIDIVSELFWTSFCKCVPSLTDRQVHNGQGMGVEKPALPEKPAFKMSLNEVVGRSLILTISSTTSKVSDALIKKVLDQVDDGINFGESAYSPKGSPKLNRRPNGGRLHFKSFRDFCKSMICRAFLSAPIHEPFPVQYRKENMLKGHP